MFVSMDWLRVCYAAGPSTLQAIPMRREAVVFDAAGMATDDYQNVKLTEDGYRTGPETNSSAAQCQEIYGHMTFVSSAARRQFSFGF